MYAVDTMGNPMDWNAAAVEAADRIQAHRFEKHNGAVCWWKRSVFVAFGNDGYTQDEASRGEVDLLRQRLEDLQIIELGFGVDSDTGYTWAMLVQPEDYLSEEMFVEELAALVTEARRISKGIGFDMKDPCWEAYKQAQGLSEPSGALEMSDEEE